MKSKPVFEDAKTARVALSLDKLGTVYRTAKKVFVITRDGTGEFTPQEWDASEEGKR